MFAEKREKKRTRETTARQSVHGQKKRPLYAVLHFGRAIKNYARQKYILNTGKSLPDAARKYTQAAEKGKSREREREREQGRVRGSVWLGLLLPLIEHLENLFT